MAGEPHTTPLLPLSHKATASGGVGAQGGRCPGVLSCSGLVGPMGSGQGVVSWSPALMTPHNEELRAMQPARVLGAGLRGVARLQGRGQTPGAGLWGVARLHGRDGAPGAWPGSRGRGSGGVARLPGRGSQGQGWEWSSGGCCGWHASQQDEVSRLCCLGCPPCPCGFRHGQQKQPHIHLPHEPVTTCGPADHRGTEARIGGAGRVP